jgi:hypothetical protein
MRRKQANWLLDEYQPYPIYSCVPCTPTGHQYSSSAFTYTLDETYIMDHIVTCFVTGDAVRIVNLFI